MTVNNYRGFNKHKEEMDYDVSLSSSGEIMHFEYGNYAADYSKEHFTPMRWIGFKDSAGTPVYEEDIYSLKASDIAEDSGFWRSNAGEEMKVHGVDEYVVHIQRSEYLEIIYELFLKKDGKYMTDAGYFKLEPEEIEDEDNKLYTIRDTGKMFLMYLRNHGALVIGNTFQNPELLIREE